MDIIKHEYEWSVDHPQYWQGASVRDFADIAVGTSFTLREAFNDACDQLASNGWNTDALELPQEIINADVADADIHVNCETDENDDHEECELLAYFVIRVTDESDGDV